MRKQKINIILPSYNEELNLPKLLKKIDLLVMQCPVYEFTIYVINDGSRDNTSEVSKSYTGNFSKKVVDLIPNRGLAGAMREGFKVAIDNTIDTDIIVALDADDSQNPLLIERMIKQINEGSDVVIASRYQKGSLIVGLTALRTFYSRVAGLLFQIFVGVKGVRDYTCGFRAYKASILKKTMGFYGEKFIEEQGFACMAEILLKLNKQGALFHEVPMILRYDQKEGDSKMNVFKTIKNTLRLIIKKV